jgi:catechol 2,3-dioxygenase-like lactoylglutathione lyase family enzyme
MSPTLAVPVLRVADAEASLTWYARLGFEEQFRHRFEPGMPLYVGIVNDGAVLHLSEHLGDANPGGLVYLWVPDAIRLAARCGVARSADDSPWVFETTDLDGNRIRVGTAET